MLIFVISFALMFVAMIPAIIAEYRYFMVEYLLAENPELYWKDALKQSSQMMRGNKWATFVLGLSFLGWSLLGACACYVGALFVNPYIEATHAQLYIQLRNQYFPGPVIKQFPDFGEETM